MLSVVAPMKWLKHDKKNSETKFSNWLSAEYFDVQSFRYDIDFKFQTLNIQRLNNILFSVWDQSYK
jgi:hypothetical protein